MRYFLDLIPCFWMERGGKKWMIPLKRWHYAVSSIHPADDMKVFPNERPLDMTSQWLGWTCSKYPTLRSHDQPGSNKMASLSCDVQPVFVYGEQWSAAWAQVKLSCVFLIYSATAKKCKAKNGYYWRLTSFNPNYSLFSARPTWQRGIRLVPFDCFVMKKQGASSSSGLEYISLVTQDINLWDLLLWAISHLSVFNSPEKLGSMKLINNTKKRITWRTKITKRMKILKDFCRTFFFFFF